MLRSKYLTVATLDYHNPDDFPVDAGFDAEGFAETLKGGGVDAVYVFGKCHYGNSYYPTHVARRHPLLKRDVFGETLEACHTRNIGVIGYLSGFLDSYAARIHQDWRLVKADGEFLKMGVFDAICPYGPYVDEWLIPQIIEMASMYTVDEMFIDSMCSYWPCYCEHCARAFADETGLALPRGRDEEGWNQYATLRQKWAYDMHVRCADAAHSARQQMPFTFNAAFGAREPTQPPPGLDYSAIDVDQTDYQALALGYQARYLDTTGLPFEVMTGRCLQGLGDWSLRTPEALQQQAAVVTSLGGRVSIIDRRLPGGGLDPAAYEVIAKVSRFVKERKELLVDTESAPGGTLILHSSESAFGAAKADYGINEILIERQVPIVGAHRALADWGEYVRIVGSYRVAELLPSAAALVMPEQRLLPEGLFEHLTKFVEGGGALIASHPVGLVSERMAELFGAEPDGEEPWRYGYLDRGQGEPLLVHGRWGRYRAAGAEVLGWHRLPMGEPGAVFGHGVAPFRASAAGPGLMVKRHGSGASILLACPIFSSHKAHHNLHIPGLIKGLLRTYARTIAEIEAPPEVQMAVRKRGDSLLIHLVNTGGERVIEGWPTVDYIRPVSDIEIRLRKTGVQAVFAHPGRTPVDFHYEGAIALIRPPTLDIHMCLEILA